MDRKQVTRNVKKHKKTIFVVALVLLTVIAYIFLLISLKRQDKEQQVLSAREQERFAKEQEQFFKEQEQLIGMTDYLHELDNTVTLNTDHLDNLLQLEAEKILSESSTELLKLNDSLLHVENLIDKYAKQETIQNNETLLSITSALSDSQQEIHSQITTLNAFISSALSDIKNSEEKNFAVAFEKLNNLHESLTAAEKNAKDYYFNLENLITLLQKENSEDHMELLNGLLDMKKEISLLLDDWFSKIQMQAEEDFTALSEKMESLHTKIINAEDSIAALLELIEQGNKRQHAEIISAFTSIEQSLAQIVEDYTNAHSEITNLIQKLEETENVNHAETLSTLITMEQNMEQASLENLTRITTTLQDMEANFSAAANSIKGEITQNFSSLSNDMTEYNNSVEEQFNQLGNSLTNHEQNFSSSINNMKNEMIQNFSSLNREIVKNISEYNNSTKDILQQMETNITNQYKTLSNTVINYDTSQQQNLDNLINTINQRLQEVFRFVSNGKNNIASALLTKGVSIRSDATFQEICNAILSIPQELLIGVQEIPGTVTYDYHYHVTQNGNMTHSENEPTAGGCYTSPIYHTHVGDSRNGGGCYTVPINHNHTDNCYTVTKTIRRVTAKWFTNEGTGHACCASGYGQNWARYTYIDEIYINDELISSTAGDGDLGFCCGLCFERKAAEQAYSRTNSEIVCGYSEGLNGYETGCGKNNQAPESYIPSCGYVDGQIIGAHITYNQSATVHSNAAIIETPESTAETEICKEDGAIIADIGVAQNEEFPAEETTIMQEEISESLESTEGADVTEN